MDILSNRLIFPFYTLYFLLLEILFGDEPLTAVKAGILATVTTPGDSRIREIVNKALPKGGFDWVVVQALRI